MISRSSRNCPPSSVPFPAMVSSSTVVRCSGRSTALSVSATWRIPVSVPLARVAARVEIVIVPRQVLQPVQVIRGLTANPKSGAPWSRD